VNIQIVNIIHALAWEVKVGGSCEAMLSPLFKESAFVEGEGKILRKNPLTTKTFSAII